MPGMSRYITRTKNRMAAVANSAAAFCMRVKSTATSKQTTTKAGTAIFVRRWNLVRPRRFTGASRFRSAFGSAPDSGLPGPPRFRNSILDLFSPPPNCGDARQECADANRQQRYPDARCGALTRGRWHGKSTSRFFFRFLSSFPRESAELLKGQGDLL